MVVSPPPLVSSYGGHHPSLGCRRYSCQACGLPSVARRQPSEGWWRWGESNPRPKRLWPNIYACSPPLVSHPVRRRTGLSGHNRSVIRGPSARTERPRASPARLCRCGLAGVRRATSGPLIRPRERNRCSQLQFFPFFNEANENPRRAIWSPRIPSKPDHPQVPLRKTARIIFFLPRPVKGDAEISEKTRF